MSVCVQGSGDVSQRILQDVRLYKQVLRYWLWHIVLGSKMYKHLRAYAQLPNLRGSDGRAIPKLKHSLLMVSPTYTR